MEKPTSDEKFLAALTHASVLFIFLGPVVPTIIWTYQRNKSKYVRFHALQAMGYQALIFWLWMIGMLVLLIGGGVLIGVIGAFAQDALGDMDVFPFLLQPLIFLGMFGLMGLIFLGGFVGAVFCMLDRDFNYPLIGSWLKKKIFNEQLTESEAEVWEDNWVSGVCHATAIMQLWGVITPIIVWFSQKERSAKLRFQALQATIYQLIATAAYFIGMILYFVFFFTMIIGMIILLPDSSSTGDPVGLSSTLGGIIAIIFMVIFMLVYVVAMLATPLYYFGAAFASIRTMRGKDFRYPILGKMIAGRMERKTIQEVAQP